MAPTKSILAGALLLLASLPGAAQNLLTNPGFATDLSGWTVGTSDITAVWQSLDATGQSNSGSAAVTNPIPGVSNGIFQCVTVTAGVAYDFGARVEIPPGQPAGAGAEVDVDCMPGPN